MYVRIIAGFAILLSLGFPAVHAAAPVPRDSPELTIIDPSGKIMQLSNFKGRVVLLEFLLVKCQRCVNAAQTINKLQSELGPRGFQPIGVAIDNNASGPAVTGFTQTLQINYPVGSTTSDKVDHYLGRAPTEHFQVPQIVLIDRDGVIRAQSRPVGETDLQDEAFLRKLIEQLLDESASAGKSG
jgi:peroxiredoxin